MYLENINGPEDVKKLDIGQLNVLADEVRHFLIEKLSNHGGHVGPNLGMVEATVALHYVFNSPEDKIVFDVSHQSYTHKILTGRKQAFMNPEHYDDVTGYSEPSESAHDHFVIGHTSTSVSLACGLAKGRDLAGGGENVIAVIGDGSLSGGEALEGLNVAGAELRSNLIIVVNDNQMSIAENHGGLYKNLQLLRETGGLAENNIFKALGLEYVYVAEGNDIASLIDAFEKVKDTDYPVVVHINTLKGKGLTYAEENKEKWHYGAPFDVQNGEPKFRSEDEDYGDLTARYLLEKMHSHPQLVAITSGTPAVLGFTRPRREQAGKQFVDVGIAEETAVAMASGIAKRGGKPVWGVYSTFIQRTYDQLSQDLCINDNPALMLVFWGGIESMNDVTHTCFYDISLLANIPNLIYLAPSCREEYFAMLDWAIGYREHPVAIRVPVGGVISRADVRTENVDWSVPAYEITRRGSRVAILGLGSYYQKGEETCELLEAQGVEATLVNPRIITSLDTGTLEALKSGHELVVTLEDGQIDGGWGEKIARFYGNSGMMVLVRGQRKQFEDHYIVEELLKEDRLTPQQIAEDVINLIGKK
ncbi:MAG: 1-deoxy-D-xylulose-5-phosphate synthase [Bacteroidia bacterium]|nr:1-deoxy-D-xylulose-5-phosphate synthase [Bacteroidia bacterium]